MEIRTYTASEVANLLHLKKTDKVDQLRLLGVLQGIKKGRGYIYPYFEIDEFLHDFIGLDISNEEEILKSKEIALERKKGC